ncbi:MAG: hypothetical protein U0V73_04165 [Acidimicrobiia bacterium]
MAIDERSRHELYRKLEQVLGADEATTLMEHLPPVGWADVATKRDLDHLEANMTAQTARLEARLHQEITAQTRAMIFSLVSTVLAVAGLGLLR